MTADPKPSEALQTEYLLSVVSEERMQPNQSRRIGLVELNPDSPSISPASATNASVEASQPASRTHSATLTISEAATLIGISSNHAYTTAKREGELVGVEVLRVGRRLLVPRARMLEVLGLNDPADPIGRSRYDDEHDSESDL